MAFGKNIYWLKEIDREYGLEFIILCYRGGDSGNHDLEAWITPSQGSNLCRLSVDGRNVIDFERDLLKVDFTGTPVLYPTPNRVRNGVLHYQGHEYPQVKRGTTILEHGLVHNEAWNYREPEVKNDAVCLKTWINFEPGTAIFEAFPFLHRLTLEYCLNETGLKITYSIKNQGKEPIPFGFGLHPYFKKLDGEHETQVELPAGSVMETTADLLPTGKLTDVIGTPFDLHIPVAIGKLDLDHVFTRVPTGKYARVTYHASGLSVSLTATEDFSHMVLYSPAGFDFFCLENQTCSTDAHNLYARGYPTESGLKFVSPGKTHTGSVAYELHKE